MSELHFPDLHIQGFRGIRDVEIPQLGRVTLITGKNNTGKSSVLEALRLHVENAAPYIIHSILAFREEFNRRTDEEERPFDADGEFHISPLFHGFPRLLENFEPIVISTSGKTEPMKLTLRIGWFVEEQDDDWGSRLVERENGRFADPEDVVALVADSEERRQILRLESLRRYIHRRQAPRRPRDRMRMPCTFVSPYSGEQTAQLEHLWDGIVLTDSEKDVVDALRIIDPRISAVSMIGAEAPVRARTAIVRADNIPRPVPLRSFGDGVNRLFAIVLSLVNAQGGILLIDEFENGLHYSVQLNAWQTVFKLAQGLGVQVFATSHSRDTIEAFQKAAAESPEDGALVKLTRRGDTIFSTVFAEQELAVATRHKIEVR